MSGFSIDNAGKLICDINTLISTRMLVQANSGGGKSWLLRRILEQTHGHVQQLVIDPEGEFASLREKFDYVHAMPHGGDTVANPRSAALLAERLLELGVSAILDIYELHPYERVRFVKLFLEALVNAPKRLWHPVLVVVDESHTFAPEKTAAESLSAMIGLASLGRKRGFAALYATQRIQKLHKDAAADLNNKLIGRTSLDVDVARAGDELGFGKERRRELIHLAPGQFFATGPAFNQRGVVLVDVGKVKTTHPEAGARIAFTAPPPTSKIKALLPKLSDLPAEAEERQKSVDELKADNARLKRELEAKPKVALPPEPKVVEVSVLTEGDRLALMRLPERFEELREDIASIAAKIKSQARTTQTIVGPLTPKPAYAKLHPEYAKTLPRGGNGYTAKIVGERKLGPLERAMLTVLAQEGRAIAKERLAAIAGYSVSGHFNNTLGGLRSTGRIEGDGSNLRITNEGLEALGPYEPRPTGHELLLWWCNKVTKIEREILTVLSDVAGQMAKEDIASAAGYSVSGHFNNMLGHLRTLGLVEGYKDQIQLVEALR